MSELKFRHEVKHLITYQDCIIIRQRMRAFASIDSHAVNGTYDIHSLYFDNVYDKALFEKLNGMGRREKFRIRYYNKDYSCINLEKKSKIDNLCNKQSAPMTVEELRLIVAGNTDWMMSDSTANRPLIRELYTKMRGQGLRPRTIVDYTRDPFIYKPGNVRVTIDYNISEGRRPEDFLDPERMTVPVRDGPIILEVKWDEFLPDIVRDAVQLDNRRAGAFSKYAACRGYCCM